MNRKDFQELSRIRLKEAKALLDLGLWDGAYYLAGYAVEWLDAPGPGEEYRLINDSLDAAGFPLRRTPVIVVLPMTATMVTWLARLPTSF